MTLAEFLSEISKEFIKFQKGQLAAEQITKLDTNIKNFLRKVEERRGKLEMFSIKIPQGLPEAVKTNLNEAVNCYLLNLDVASYSLVLRTIELAINYYHQKLFPNKKHLNFRSMVEDLKVKTVNRTLFNFMGFQYEERNEVIHSLYVPGELELLSAIDLTIKYVSELDNTLKHQTKSLPKNGSKR